MSNPYAPPDPASRPDRGRPDHAGADDRTNGDRGSPGREQPGPGRGHPRPERPQPSPEQLAATSRSVLRFGLLMLVAVLVMQMDLPWQMASLGFAVAALVVGVRALVRVIRHRQRGGIVVLLVFGLSLSGMLAVTSLSSLALWNEQMQRQECLRSALTVTAHERCEREFQQALEERFDETP